jgi:ribosomal protein L11 methyltransferase
MKDPIVLRAWQTRVDIFAAKGTEELLPEEAYSLLSNAGIWVEEKGEDIVIKAYPKDVEAFLEQLRLANIKIKKVNVETEKELDYAELTKKYFRPIRIDDVTIVAPWNKTKRDGVRIVIEPGMAFGTGRHESTRIMLKLMKQADFRGKTVLDIGCGSAILSLYASLLGAKKVEAIDNDPDAVESANKNIALNNARSVTAACNDLRDVSGRYDVVLANLDIRTFTAFSDKVKGLVKKNGTIIISGVLGKDKKRVLDLFLPLAPLHAEKKNAWIGLVLGSAV